jgi:hypothetical protein
MKKITSLSKMRECMPIPGSKKKVYFVRGEETILEDSECKALLEDKDCMFKFLVDEGSLIISDIKKEEEPKPLSKKEKKKLADEEKKRKEKEAGEAKKARQAK